MYVHVALRNNVISLSMCVLVLVHVYVHVCCICIYVLFVSCLFGMHPICRESRGREAPEGE